MLKRLFSIHRINFGFCPICQRRAWFIARGEWLRETYRCQRCGSIPRFRAFICTLEAQFPEWRELAIHESSPLGAASDKIRRECRNYLGTQFYPDLPPGETRNGYRCENLEKQTFPDASFDLVVTQDVFEHILHPGPAFKEIARTLKPGGAHLFTVPWYYWQKTMVRVSEAGGVLTHHQPAIYHGNPISAEGSLVITDWGSDMIDYIYGCTGMVTTAIRIRDTFQGIEAKFNEVFISRKQQVSL